MFPAESNKKVLESCCLPSAGLDFCIKKTLEIA
jgi:hypothetical protein